MPPRPGGGAVPRPRSRPCVIAVGNRRRGDDAAGLQVADRLRAFCGDTVRTLESGLDPASLFSAWAGHAEVVLVDAVCSDAAAGTIHRFDAARHPLPVTIFSRASTHTLGLAECIEMARALGCLPERLWVYGIEGGCFGLGAACSEPVQRSVATVAEEIHARWFGKRVSPMPRMRSFTSVAAAGPDRRVKP